MTAVTWYATFPFSRLVWSVGWAEAQLFNKPSRPKRARGGKRGTEVTRAALKVCVVNKIRDALSLIRPTSNQQGIPALFLAHQLNARPTLRLGFCVIGFDIGGKNLDDKKRDFTPTPQTYPPKTCRVSERREMPLSHVSRGLAN